MKFIEITLGDVACRARLLEDKAPKTCAAVWDALPFGGTAVHAQVSGQMFRMLDPAPLPDLELESPERHQYPGELVYFPPINEIAFCVGEAQFSATYGGKYQLTPLAEIEEDFSEWAKAGDDLQYTGARPIRFARAEDQSTPFRFAAASERQLRVQLGDAVVHASVLPEAASAVDHLFGAGSVDGRASNSTWAGPMTRCSIDTLPSLPDSKGRSSTFHWPGYIYYDRRDGALFICYGDAEEGVQGNPVPLLPIARLTKDLAAYASEAGRQGPEGAKPIRFQLV